MYGMSLEIQFRIFTIKIIHASACACYKLAREDTVVNAQTTFKVGKTNIYRCRTLKIKPDIKFHSDMVVKEVDARISDILIYCLKIYCRDNFERSIK
jgi:hypothetical protein